MEDAVEALKIGFAVLVFAIALTIFFKMVDLAKSTSDIVLYSIDKANYYSYSNKDGVENRIVTLKDIIPTIYRYKKENYGVTIIDKDANIVARFDLGTEEIVSSWKTSTPEAKENQLKNFEKIFKVSGKNNKYSSESDLVQLFTKIYGVREETALHNYSQYAVQWKGSDASILKRLKSDIYGDEVFEDHKAVCKENGLVKTYGFNTKFTEYVFEIDLNEYVYNTGDISDYYSRKTENYNLDEAMLYIRGTNKMEIIYVEKE